MLNMTKLGNFNVLCTIHHNSTQWIWSRLFYPRPLTGTNWLRAFAIGMCQTIVKGEVEEITEEIITLWWFLPSKNAGIVARKVSLWRSASNQRMRSTSSRIRRSTLTRNGLHKGMRTPRMSNQTAIAVVGTPKGWWKNLHPKYVEVQVPGLWTKLHSYRKQEWCLEGWYLHYSCSPPAFHL